MLTIDDDKQWANWQSRLPSFLKDKSTFKDWIYPGTHDSAAYGSPDLTHTSEHKPIPLLMPYIRWIPGVRNLATNMTRMQETDVYTQLEHGVRYLDLRVARPAGLDRLYMAHAFAYQPADVVLAQIARFMDEYSEEVLLVLVRNQYHQNTTTTDIVNIVLRYLGKFAHPNAVNHRTYASWSEMVAKNERVVLVYEGARTQDTMITKSSRWWQAEQLFSWAWIVNDGDWKERTDFMVDYCKKWKEEYIGWDPARYPNPEKPKKMLIWSHEISLSGKKAVQNYIRQWLTGNSNPVDTDRMTFRQHASHYNNLFSTHFTDETALIPSDIRADIGIVHVDFEWEVCGDVMGYVENVMKLRMLDIETRTSPVFA